MTRKLIGIVLVLIAVQASALTHDCDEAMKSVNANPDKEELKNYAAIESLRMEVKPENYINNFQAKVGFSNIKRDANGNATEATIRVLADNDNDTITVIGPFNDWGKNIDPNQDVLHKADGRYYEGKIRGLSHGMQYRFLLKDQNGVERQVLDPAATTDTTPEYLNKMEPGKPQFFNSVFWDHDRPGGYKMETTSVDLRGKYLDLGEVEALELVSKWKGGPKTPADTFKFIAESGVIDELKKMGYNAIEFLPFAPSVNGNAWNFRYQVFDIFGPNSYYGTPEEFKKMADAFNKAGIGIVMDAVVGHFPYNGNNGVWELGPVGEHQFKKADGSNLYGNETSPWGTLRYDYNNPWIRQYLIDGIITNMKEYGISGIRFDNLDGIKGYPGGGGETFLRDLSAEIRKRRPETVLIGEMFFGQNSVMKSLEKGGMGINMRTNSDLFDFFKDNMQKRTEEIDMNKLRDAIRNPWGWGEAMRINYITNHDEAANGRGGATGAYPASILKGDDSSWPYVEKKVKAFAALARLSGTASMDMPQMRFLQEGTFYSNTPLDWDLMRNESQRRTKDYFAQLSWAMKDKEAFAPQNLGPNIENHTDYDNKVISLERIDHKTGKKYIAIINLGHRELPNYAFGVNAQGTFKVISDSDRGEFGGTNRLADAVGGYGNINASQNGMHGKSNSLNLPVLAPYEVILLEQQ